MNLIRIFLDLASVREPQIEVVLIGADSEDVVRGSEESAADARAGSGVAPNDGTIVDGSIVKLRSTAANLDGCLLAPIAEFTGIATRWEASSLPAPAVAPARAPLYTQTQAVKT